MAAAWVTTRSTDALLGACLFERLGLFFSLVYQTENVEVIEATSRLYSECQQQISQIKDHRSPLPLLAH
jgi:hypothetical protein